MTSFKDPARTAAPTHDLHPDDLRARLVESLRHRDQRRAREPRHVAPSSQQPPAPIAYVVPRANREPGIETALRREHLTREADDRPPPQWAKITRGQNIAGLAVFALILAALWAVYGMSVNRDMLLAGTYKPDRTVRVEQGSCTRYYFTASFCSAHVIDTAAADPQPAGVSYLVLFRNLGGVPLVGVRSARDPSAVSVRLATDDALRNRVATLYSLTALGLLFCMIFARRLMTGRYAGGPALELPR